MNRAACQVDKLSVTNCLQLIEKEPVCTSSSLMLTHQMRHIALFRLSSFNHHELHIVKIDRAPLRFQHNGMCAGGDQDRRKGKSADHGTKGRKPFLIFGIKRHVFGMARLTEVRKLCQSNFLFHFCSSILHLQLFFGYGILQKVAGRAPNSAPTRSVFTTGRYTLWPFVPFVRSGLERPFMGRSYLLLDRNFSLCYYA